MTVAEVTRTWGELTYEEPVSDDSRNSFEIAESPVGSLAALDAQLGRLFWNGSTPTAESGNIACGSTCSCWTTAICSTCCTTRFSGTGHCCDL